MKSNFSHWGLRLLLFTGRHSLEDWSEGVQGKYLHTRLRLVMWAQASILLKDWRAKSERSFTQQVCDALQHKLVMRKKSSAEMR